jgi:uncharacterized protein (DUF488 family)
MNTIYTVGYEGANVDDFAATLKLVGVKILVDIRALPISRKPGFSKRSLAATLTACEVRYVHVPALGDPKPGRDAARAGDLPAFRRIFIEHLGKDDAQGALAELAQLATESTICLLCFERDHACCHRSMVADALRGTGRFKIKNIGVRAGLVKMEAKRVPVAGRSRHVG